jgi:UDP-N-acetylglucosamine 4,6-dehydratase
MQVSKGNGNHMALADGMSLNGSVILITGGTGSFGKKFVETILSGYRPKKLIIFSRDELKQLEMRQDFPDNGDSPVRYFLGDVRDRDRLERAFHNVDIVVHAAALKQVPACEYNPFEAIQTNVMGARNVIDASINQGVKKVMAISTDKAVNPVNLYGATKLCAEKLFVHGNAYSGEDGCRFSCARYGNVVGSRGSVVQLFLEQRKSRTVTVTDPRMSRFWINLEQGVRFVIRCVEGMKGGEVFVPKIPSMNVMDVAKTLAPECDIRYLGIRPGEKLHEVLVSEDEARHTVELEDMYIIKPAHPWWREINWKSATPIAEGFSYRSDTNSRWLTAHDFQELVYDHNRERVEVAGA